MMQARRVIQGYCEEDDFKYLEEKILTDVLKGRPELQLKWLEIMRNENKDKTQRNDNQE